MYIKYYEDRDITRVGKWIHPAKGKPYFRPHPTAILETHARGECTLNDWCVIHRPNPAWDFGRLYWRDDRRIMERVCRHGVGHPAIEQVQYWFASMTALDAEVMGTHGCDGCCFIETERKEIQINA